MLVFKFNKNDKSDKKKGDALNGMMMDYANNHNEEQHDTSYDQFKMVSVVEDSPRERQVKKL